MSKRWTQTNEINKRKKRIPTLSANTWQDQIRIETTAFNKSHHQIWAPRKHTYKRSLRNKTRRRRKWEDEQENKENIKKLEGEYKNYTLAEWRKWIDALKLEKLASKMKK
ncbi:hypothetical protein KY284_001024 [Solanum tuberosum]|nr:hypothetical protein KY284_001024 [Solanum tuberosum]